MRRWLLIGLLLCSLLGCENFNNQNPVPYVPVNYTLKITEEHPHFMIDNGYQTMTITRTKFEREYLGYAGLLIWIGMDGHYHAADLCCPNCVNKTKPVTIDGLYAVCPICEEKFDLSYGFAIPTKGITKYPLRKYQAILNSTYTGHTLRITN
jgi:nitrite reductase/ring-hydroxylating ferredoxin subunit